MKTGKRVISVVLCLIMLFGAVVAGSEGFAETISVKVSAANYTVTFNANGGSGAPESQTGNGSVTIPNSSPTKNGYIFLGWATKSNAKVGNYQSGDTITVSSNITLYAVWLYNENPAKGDVDGDGTISLMDLVKIRMHIGGEEQLFGLGLSCADCNGDGVVNDDDAQFVRQALATGEDRVLTYISNGGSGAPQGQSGSGSIVLSNTKPTRFGCAFLGWSVSSTATSAQYQPGATFNLDGNKILYAVWKNIYNLGEESYSFENYVDNDSPYGHCFGMAVTSSGYYLGTLNKSIIGGNDSSSLYSFSDSKTVRKPICHYIQIQGSAADGAEYKSMVAGGSIDLEDYIDIGKDWFSCVNYVKNHEHDNKGTLNVGMWYLEGGGHAVNFLYYKEVNGQQRIYVYDNNYPDTEMYYYMSSDGYVHEGPSNLLYRDHLLIGIDLMDVNVYFPLADQYKPYKYVYADKNEIVVEGATYCYLKCDSELSDYVMYEIPENAENVMVTPLVDNADFQYLGKDYSFGKINEKTSGVLTIPSKNATDGQTTGFVIKNAPDESLSKAKLKVKSSATVDYRSKVNITATASGVPKGFYVAIYNGKKLLEKGDNTKVVFAPEDSNGKPLELTADKTYTVKIIDAKGNVQKDANGKDLTSKIEIKVKQGFFDKFIAFFKGLFGLLPTVEIKQ